MAEQFDVVVIGGGTAGLVTASGCARLGRRVALIEREKLGGDCLWTGCVPTKALVATAKLAHQMRHAADWGLEPVEPRITPRAIMESMRKARAVTAVHDDPEKFRKLGIAVIEGEATFTAPNEVSVAGRKLRAKDIVIATGSRTSVPPVEGLEAAGYIDHASFLKQDEFPRSIVILGGGSIGIEFAQIFRRFGCEVTVVEMLEEIINKEDAEVIALVRRVLEGEGIQLRTGWAVKRVRSENGKKIASIESQSGDRSEIRSDQIFVASGRRGNVEGLGLEAIGVKTRQSYVQVNAHLQTSVPRIWACGDVHGGLQFTHVAAYEAVKLVRNILFPSRSAVEYEHIPWALYTDPEVAHIGMTEAEAVRTLGGEDVRTFKVEMEDVDRAVVDRTRLGFVKLICDRKGRIVGGHVAAAQASAWIPTIVLARKRKMTIGQLAGLVTPYPSLADALGKAAAQHYQELNRSWVGAVGRKIAALSQ